MKNQSYTSHTKRTARMVSIAGGVLFWIFSLAYLAVFQGNMLVLRVYDLFHKRMGFGIYSYRCLVLVGCIDEAVDRWK